MYYGLGNLAIPNILNAKLNSLVVRAGRLNQLDSVVKLLFSNDEPGFLFLADPATCFTDTAGTTQAGPGDPVALWLDQSRGLELGPELVTNGDFSAGSTGWTVPNGWSITGGAAVGVAVSASLFGGGVTPIAGRTYRVDFDVVSYTSGDLLVTVGGNFSGNPRLFASQLTPGRKSVMVVAGSAPSRGVEFYGGAVTVTIDNISVRELPGAHATQETSANRPILGRKPVGGRRNIALFSQDFDNAVWIRTTSNISKTGDYWTLQAQAAADDTPRIRQDDVFAATGPRLSWWEVKAGTHSRVQINLSSSPSAGGDITVPAIFELSDGTIVDQDGGASITPLDDGWFRIAVWSDQDTTAGTQRRFSLAMVNPAASNAGSSSNIRFASDGSETILIRKAQAEASVAISDYQRVGSRFDVTEAGKPNRHYLFFGGSADPRWMQTPVITPGTDKVQVFAGVRKLSDETNQHIVDTTEGSGSNRFQIWVPGSSVYRLSQNHGETVTIDQPATAPHSGVLSYQSDRDLPNRNNPFSAFALNKSRSDSDNDPGDLPVVPSKVTIGARGSDLTRPFNGEISALTTRFGPNLTTNQIEQVERFTASKVAEDTI